MNKKIALASLSCTLACVGFETASFAGPATGHFPVPKLMTTETSAAPVSNAAFLPAQDALPAAAWSGVLTIAQARMEAMPQLVKPVQQGRDARLFPGVTLELFTDGDVLVPVQRGTMVRESQTVSTPSYWRVIPQFGRVWREPGDGNWSRAALPLNLVNDTENHAHQGVATFLYRDGEISALRMQFVQQTAPYLLKQHFVMWGPAIAKLAPGDAAELGARRAAARLELSSRLPAKPWSELVKQFPPGTLDGYGGPLYPKWQVLNAIFYNGILYYQDSPTPYGPFPYPLEMRFGVRSVMKSVAAPLAMLRLAEVYGPYVLTLKIGDYVKGLDPKFNRVRFIDAANMATGFGGTGTFKTHPNDTGDGYLDGDYDAWYTAPSIADKLAQINENLRPYPWEPGAVMRYRDQDYFLLGLALDRFVKSVRGPETDLWEMLATEVLKPIGIHQAPAVRTREPDGRDGVVWANAGYYPSIDDLAKIALLYQRLGLHNGQQLLHRQLTRNLLAAKNAIVQSGDASMGAAVNDVKADQVRHYLMGFRFLRYVGSRSKKLYSIPAMHGSGDNRVTLFPNGIIGVQMAKAAELPPNEEASSDDATATLRAIDRMVPF
jgi:CubicO group peptidase (beta-lactamase class C family)